MLEKCLSDFNIKKFSNVYFSTGPGSFTALRSIKAISQALALSSSSKILTASSFAPLLSSVQTNEKKVLVCFKSTNNKFFYQLFEKTVKIFKSKLELKFGDQDQLLSYYFEKKKSYNDLLLISSEKLVNINKTEMKYVIKKIDASDFANSVIVGYGSKNTKILYHNTYYEKS